MIAALPMYDFPWTADALDAIWAALSRRLVRAGIPAPASLTRDRPIEAVWRDPELILGQTCGYPYRKHLRGVVDLIATPSFAFEGCEGADHCSFLIARGGDARRTLAEFRGARAAINARDSNTGANLFRAAVAPLAGGRSFFVDVVVTGAHAASLAAVARGDADIAAIDCISYALLSKGKPELVAQVETIGRTPSTPGLPFIASAALELAARNAVRECLFEALADPALVADWAKLGVIGAQVVPSQAYDRVEDLEANAIALGYAELT